MNGARLAELRDLSGMVRDARLAAVEQVVARLNAIQADIATLNASREERLAQTDLDAARLSGADMTWMRWGEVRLAELQRRHAALRVAHEEALKAARKAFGRADVLSELARTRMEEERVRKAGRT